MGRKQLNHVQYKRNIHPDFVNNMDLHLNALKRYFKKETIEKHTNTSQTKKLS